MFINTKKQELLNCYIFSILENFWIIFKNPANPAKIWPEPEPEPDWKILAGLAGTGTGTGYPVAHWPRPAQKLGVKYSFPPDYPRGANGAPNCSSHHPDSSHIGFDGSRTNSLAVAAQNAIAEIGRGCLNWPLLGHNSPKNRYFWLDFSPGVKRA